MNHTHQPNSVKLTDATGGLAEVPDLLVGLALADADGQVAVEEVGLVVLHARPRRGIAEGRGGGLQAGLGGGEGTHQQAEDQAARRHRSEMIETQAATFLLVASAKVHLQSNREDSTYDTPILTFNSMFAVGK